MVGKLVFQATFVPVCLGMAFWAVVRLWRRRVPKRFGIATALLWSAAAMAIAVPDSTRMIATWMGIGRGADFVFYLAILGGMAISFHFYHRFRQTEILLTELIRRDALAHAKRGGEQESTPTTTF